MALSDEKREQIKALLATGAAKNDVAKKCKVSWATVDSISKEAPDKIENFREQKRMSFVDRIWENIDDALELGHMKIKVAKEGTQKLSDMLETIADSRELSIHQAQDLAKAIEAATTVPLSHISTYIGTLYDKQALSKGESTNNTHTTVTLEGDLEKWAN